MTGRPWGDTATSPGAPGAPGAGRGGKEPPLEPQGAVALQCLDCGTMTLTLGFWL